ncbi:hypothetical protein [Tautonia plasticadhaerens]|uniref:Uncharacterized protein n=1 Tax=Tautonia plasticadhaerens TaxID=2527974 RepID=A0A518H4E7_9BACT|nr:hypothetical protein [Tautonia plasticadhaerens]QDV35712.1 hypothetical protein ElP_36170 [Tautonia plasticadhaerens]
MNRNMIVTGGWSNDEARTLYEAGWPGEPEVRRRYKAGEQCGGCSYYAKFNSDWGLCCHPASRHRLETVFEHFTCPVQVNEGWGPHSFSDDLDFHCRCQGEPLPDRGDPGEGTVT